MSLIRLSADNPASLLAAAVLVIVFGIVGIITLPIQMLPDIEYPQINVNTSWRNAAPQEIEANIIEPQEEALRQVIGRCRAVEQHQSGQRQRQPAVRRRE